MKDGTQQANGYLNYNENCTRLFLRLDRYRCPGLFCKGNKNHYTVSENNKRD